MFLSGISRLSVSAFLIRGLTLPGAADGIIYYLKPDFSTLLDFQVMENKELLQGTLNWIIMSAALRFQTAKI